MTVVTPAEVARRAATILVDIPPVPKADPALETVIVRFKSTWRKGLATVGLQSSNIIHYLNGLGIRVSPGIFVIETVHIRH